VTRRRCWGWEIAQKHEEARVAAGLPEGASVHIPEDDEPPRVEGEEEDEQDEEDEEEGDKEEDKDDDASEEDKDAAAA
jgi:hypothetical protein